MGIHDLKRATALVLLGLLGNSLALPLFYHVDFIFGSIATLWIGCLFGPVAGFFLGGLCSLPTLWLWGHPYAVVIFAAEAAFVGACYRHGRQNVILADAAYWAVLGVPLIYLFYGQVLQMDGLSMGLIMVKQSANGLANAVVAMLGLLWWRGRSDSRVGVVPVPSLAQWLFCGITGLLFLPALTLIALGSRGELDVVERSAAARLRVGMEPLAEYLRYWYERHVFAVSVLAETAEESGGNRELLEKQAEEIIQLFPDFHNMYVADSNATAIAFFPSTNLRGEPTLGLNFADRKYYQEVREKQRPVISELFEARGGVFEPIQALAVPIIVDGQFKGYALGAANLNRVRTAVGRLGDSGIEVTLTDHFGTVVASTSGGAKVMERLPGRFRGSRSASRHNLQVVSPGTRTAHMLQWRDASYMMEVGPQGNLPWRLIAEVPVAPFQAALHRAYIRNLSAALIFFLLCIGLARWLSRRLYEPFQRLVSCTSGLARDTQGGELAELKSTGVAEIDDCLTNFRAAEGEIKRVLTELRQRSEELNQSNHQLALENRTREEAEHRLRSREQFLSRQNMALLHLIKQRRFEEGFERMTEACSELLSVERASVWLYDDAQESIVCADLFERSQRTHSRGMELKATDYPDYFDALRQMRAIAANDAATDPRTSRFQDPYLKLHGIRSMLDAPVWVEGRMVGVVCHEHVGASREWTPEEVSFAGSMADLVAMRLQEVQREKAEQALRESEERYRLLIETANEGIWVVNREYRTVYVNRRLTEMLGYSADEMMGLEVLDFVFPEDLPTIKAQMAMRRKGEASQYDFRYRRRDGTELWVLSCTSPIRDAEGNFNGALGMFTDITERKRTEEERDRLLRQVQEYSADLEKRVKERTARLEEINREMESFCYSISHDLRGPLRAINSFTEIISDEYLDGVPDSGREMFCRIGSAAERMDQLICDLLSYSRVTRSELSMSDVPIGDLLEELFQSSPELQPGNAEILTDLKASRVHGNRSLLQQCFSNLLDNAVKFVKPGTRPRVRIRSESVNGRVRIHFEDNGTGIPKELQAKIFNLFERVHPEGAYQGTGIGLAIVKRAVERMGGCISVSSEVGEGTVFTIELHDAVKVRKTVSSE